MPRRLDAVDGAVGESTRLVREPRQYRDGVVPRRKAEKEPAKEPPSKKRRKKAQESSDDDDDVAVLMGRVGALGRLTDLPGDLSVVGGQLVADGRGGFISIGGDEQGLQSADNGLSDLLRLDMGRPNTSLSFVRTGDLPAQDTVNGETVSGLAGHTVTRLTAAHQFQDWLLVAGGSQGLNGSSTVTDQMLLWDPVADETVSLGSDGKLPEGGLPSHGR